MFRSITLEMSLKPFKKTNDEYIKKVCAQVFEQWYPLIKNREIVSIMLWTADGSEILDYSGDLDDKFEWACYLGNANKELANDEDYAGLILHEKKRLYMKNPPAMTYRILKKIVTTIKEEGKRVCPNAEIRVGETFDVGPEFAVSDFKYRRHTEVSTGEKMNHFEFGILDSTAILNGDDRKYAAYPNGIPDKTPFGTFLGKQCNVFLRDMGFDYIWLSNGVGFSSDPWNTLGKVFDGKKFYPEKLSVVKERVFEFWKLFREACPDFPIETRGTNNSVGIDYASDGVPLYDIYKGGLNITPPPNSPWAALNDDFGLELMGHMTRICELPGDEFLMRYYIHDPWWANTPWYDRYNGKPHDIYLPMAVSRIDEKGKVRNAELFHILSIDNSFGDMPDCCVNEPLPHILKAEKEAPDAIAPFVWIYPMREYTTASSEEMLAEMYFGDTFIQGAINAGFPLNCVVSTDNFLKHSFELYKNSILISPVQPNEKVANKLKEFVKNGGKVIYYSFHNKLNEIKTLDCEKVDIEKGAEGMLTAIAKYGYEISIIKKHKNAKTPTITIHRNNNALMFSVYNRDTTTDVSLRFPLGAPILDCGETEVNEDIATYRFSRFENRECRVFVRQKKGVVSVRERCPVSGLHRRKIFIEGLEDATVCLFPETKAIGKSDVLTWDCGKPREGWELIEDENGVYYRKENVSGSIYFSMRFNENTTVYPNGFLKELKY